MRLKWGSWTYRLHDRSILEQAGEEGDVAANSNALDALAAGDIGVGLVGEQRRDERASVGDGRGRVCAVQDMVLQNRLGHASVVHELSASGAVEQRLESLVGRGQESDVLRVREGGRQLRESAQEGRELRGLVVAGQDASEVLLLRRSSADQGCERKVLELHDFSERVV
jgi:hypothetical protein